MKAKSVDEALDENVRLGFVEITGTNSNGEQVFKLTQKGKERAEALLKANPRLHIEMGLDDGLH